MKNINVKAGFLKIGVPTLQHAQVSKKKSTGDWIDRKMLL